MADYIDREELLKIWENADSNFDYCEFHFIESINAQPSVDAVEVVRCRNCKYFSPNYDASTGVCKYGRSVGCKRSVSGFGVTINDFCSRGEKE